MRNEVFYQRARIVRDNYISNNLYLHQCILCDVFSEFFGSGDEFPSELIISGHNYSKKMIKDVLLNLGIRFEGLSQNGDYFFIYSPHMV